MKHSRRWIVPVVLSLCAAGAHVVSSAEPGSFETKQRSNSEPADDLTSLITDLDADVFEVRRRALERLTELAAERQWYERLAAAIGRALLDPDTSIEVRMRLRPLAERLPKFAPEPPTELPPGEIDRLIAGLDSERFAARLGAASRLTWLVERPEWACDVVGRFKRLRGDGSLSAEARQRIESIWEAARLAWLASDPSAWRLPDVSESQIGQWIDELVEGPLEGETSHRLEPIQERIGRRDTYSASEFQDRLFEPAKWQAAARWQVAEQELLDLLARDDYVPKVKAALEARLAAGDIDAGAEGRLSSVLEWIRPMLVAEVWLEELGIVQHRSLQYLRVGEPNYVSGHNPCLFDHVDDVTAHCVSGNSLLPGDYRVGMLFPTPNPFGSNSDAMFRLVNLPTPRRRMAYECYLKIGESKRFVELSRRTLDDLLAQKRPLKEAELMMLEHLDAVAVSRFASGYLPVQGDPEPSNRMAERRTGRGSPYQNLCCLLVEHGTRDAAPGLLAAIEAGRFPPLAGEGACAWHWLAALAIAERDPWVANDTPGADRLPRCDEWLAGLIERTDPLSNEGPATSGASPPDLGATAAAVLLSLHQVDIGRFGLEPAGDHLIAEEGGPNYVFVSPMMRRRVLDWWNQRQAGGPRGGQ